MTSWPSGLRRVTRNHFSVGGAGSNPADVVFCFFLFFCLFSPFFLFCEISSESLKTAMSDGTTASKTSEAQAPVKREPGEKEDEHAAVEPPAKRFSLCFIVTVFLCESFSMTSTTDFSESCAYCQRGSSFFVCLFVHGTYHRQWQLRPQCTLTTERNTQTHRLHGTLPHNADDAASRARGPPVPQRLPGVRSHP